MEIVGHVSGWGLTNENDKSSSSEFLRYTTVPIVSNEICVSSYTALIEIDPDIQFCAGNSIGQDACAGDSGGPYVRKIEDKFVLIGIVSFGKGCGRKEYPGVYVKLQKYVSWIYFSIEEEDVKNSSTDISNGIFQNITNIPTKNITKIPTKNPIDGHKEKTEISFKSVGPICRGSFKFLSCPRGKVIQLKKVFFGRKLNSRLCKLNSSTGKNCSLTNARKYAKRPCERKSGCWIYHGLFKVDPCPSLDKYLIVEYICVKINIMQ